MDVTVEHAELVNQPHQSRRAETTHQVGRNPVVGLGQSPFQRNHFSVSGAAAVAGCPRLAGHDIRLLHVRRKVAGRHAVFHGQRIEEGLDGGPDLTAAHSGHVVLEIAVIWSAHVGFHISRAGIHTHESCTQETFVIADRVHRRHDGIHFSVVRKYGHFLWRIECLLDVLFRCAALFHLDVTFALFHRTAHDFFHLFRRKLVGERACRLVTLFFVEDGL